MYETYTVTGKREVTLTSPPVAYPYDHAAWQRQLEALPIETCAMRDERERRAQAEAGARRKVDDYLDGRTPWADNPFRNAVCAHDVAAMREVLRIGQPRFPVSGIIADCGIDSRHPEIFDTLFPMAYANETDRAGYCHLIHKLLEQRDEASLKRLHALGLPVVCPDFGHIAKVLSSGAEGPQKLTWMRTLVGLGMDPCLATPGGVTMLQMAARGAAPEKIEFLLDAGCDPSRLPVLGHSQSGPPFASAPLAWLLRVRGFLYLPGETRPPPLAADVVERISRRLGEVTDEELRRVHPQSGVSGPLLIAAQRGEGWSAAGNAELVAWLAARGVRMDAANAFGFSWYMRGYSHTTGKPLKGHEVLDSLSVAQLRQMLKPVNLASGKPGKPLDAAKDMSDGGLGAYLCRRGAIPC